MVILGCKQLFYFKEMFTLALEKFAIPGEAQFPLNAFYEKPKNSAEADEMRKYLTQVKPIQKKNKNSKI